MADRRLPRWARWLLSLAYLGALGLVFVLSAYFAFSLFVRSGVTRAPELAGLTREEAEDLLADRGLTWGPSAVPGRASEEVPEGHVLEQRPAAGSLVKRGKPIEVILSLGPERLIVPELGGQALQAAEVALAAAGLRVGRTFSVYRGGVAAGTIVEQSPAAGQAAARDAPVDVFLAMERRGEAFVMPDLVYRRFESVRTFFEGRGFRLRDVRFEPYDGVAEGVILRQAPQAGHPVSRRDPISVVVSSSRGTLP